MAQLYLEPHVPHAPSNREQLLPACWWISQALTLSQTWSLEATWQVVDAYVAATEVTTGHLLTSFSQSSLCSAFMFKTQTVYQSLFSMWGSQRCNGIHFSLKGCGSWIKEPTNMEVGKWEWGQITWCKQSFLHSLGAPCPLLCQLTGHLYLVIHHFFFWTHSHSQSQQGIRAQGFWAGASGQLLWVLKILTLKVTGTSWKDFNFWDASGLDCPSRFPLGMPFFPP